MLIRNKFATTFLLRKKFSPLPDKQKRIKEGATSSSGIDLDEAKKSRNKRI